MAHGCSAWVRNCHSAPSVPEAGTPEGQEDMDGGLSARVALSAG